MSIGTGIFLAALGISKAKEIAWNRECMSKPRYKTSNGHDVYVDGHLREYINGEHVVRKLVIDQYGNQHYQKIGEHSGRIYNDSYEDEINSHKKVDEESLRKAKENGKLSYWKFIPERGKNMNVEISTGKPVKTWKNDLRKHGIQKVTYYKLYYKPKSETGRFDLLDYDNKIEISYEEFIKL